MTSSWASTSVGTRPANAFNVVHGRGPEGAGGAGASGPHGPAGVLLDTAHAQGGGPTSPTVTLTIPLQLTGGAGERAFTIEVAAANDSGTIQSFLAAGSLTVVRP